MVRRRAAERTLGQRAKVWALRAVLNLLILALLGAAFYGIFWATGFTVTLQVQRVLEEECPGVLELTIPAGRELRSRTPGVLRGLGKGRGWTSLLGSFEVQRGEGRTDFQLASFLVPHPPPTQEESLVQQTPILKLLVDYLPSIFISVINFVLPLIFKFITSLEGYTRSRQIVLILLRFCICGMGWELREKGTGRERVSGFTNKTEKSGSAQRVKRLGVQVS